jgi:hypothetical protein
MGALRGVFRSILEALAADLDSASNVKRLHRMAELFAAIAGAGVLNVYLPGCIISDASLCAIITILRVSSAFLIWPAP